MFEPDMQMYRTEILQRLEVCIRQEISPMIMHTEGWNTDHIIDDVVKGMVIQFSAYFWENQVTDMVEYTIPDGKWQWFKKRYMTGSRLHKVCGWFTKRFRKWKWYQCKIWSIHSHYFVVKEAFFEEKVKILYPYMAKQKVPPQMGRLSIPVMPDGVAIGLLPDAKVKQPRYKHVPIWVDQECALLLQEDAERHRVPVEDMIRTAVADSHRLSLMRR